MADFATVAELETFLGTTGLGARGTVMLGYASAAIILIGSGFLDWLLFAFPCWVLVVSIYILSENLRK